MIDNTTETIAAIRAHMNEYREMNLNNFNRYEVAIDWSNAAYRLFETLVKNSSRRYVYQYFATHRFSPSHHPSTIDGIYKTDSPIMSMDDYNRMKNSIITDVMKNRTVVASQLVVENLTLLGIEDYQDPEEEPELSEEEIIFRILDDNSDESVKGAMKCIMTHFKGHANPNDVMAYILKWLKK